MSDHSDNSKTIHQPTAKGENHPLAGPKTRTQIISPGHFGETISNEYYKGSTSNQTSSGKRAVRASLISPSNKEKY